MTNIGGMKLKIVSCLLALLVGYSPVAQGEEVGKFVKVQVDQADESLFADAEAFYAKLGNSGATDISYTSRRLFDVLEGKYGAPQAARFAVYGTPKLILLSRLNLPEESDGSYLVCCIYPYKKIAGVDVAETRVDGWVQGHRRFDIWSKASGMWKVKLEVDVNNLKDTFKTFSPLIVVCDTAEEAGLALKRIIKSEQETNSAVEESIEKKLSGEK